MKHKQLDLFDTPSIETPIKYMGGKKNLFPHITPYLPEGTKEVISPFLGGAGLELQLTSLGIKVYGSDLFEPLINFWSYWIKDANTVIEDLMKFYPLSYTERKYYTKTNLRRDLIDPDKNPVSDLRRASLYWNLSSVGWGGSNLKKSLSIDFRKLSTRRFTKFHNWQNELITVKEADYREVLENTKGKLIYLDPPYLGQEDFYFQSDFDHKALLKILKEKKNWILSHSDHEVIRSLYSPFDIKEIFWKNRGKIRKDLLILNL